MPSAKFIHCRTAPASVSGTAIGRLMLLLLALAAAGTVRAEDPTKPSTSRAARQQATQAIPYDKLDHAARQKVDAIVGNTSIYRRLPVQVIDCDPNMYLFLVRHPEVIVDIWQLMGVTDIALKRTSDVAFNATDGVGTSGVVEFLYGDHETHLILTEGSYSGPLTARPIRARCLLVLQTGYIKQPNGRYYVTNRLDAFMDVDNVGLELLARTFQNVFGKTADSNFSETAYFISKLSRTAETNAEGLSHMAAKLDDLDDATRAKFVEHAVDVEQRAIRRVAATTVRGTMQVTRGQDAPPR